MNIEPHGIEHVDWDVLVALQHETQQLRDRLERAETRLTAIGAIVGGAR